MAMHIQGREEVPRSKNVIWTSLLFSDLVQEKTTQSEILTALKSVDKICCIFVPRTCFISTIEEQEEFKISRRGLEEFSPQSAPDHHHVAYWNIFLEG